MDEFFIQWVKFPDANNCHFWEKWLREYPEKRPVVLEAAQLIRGIQSSRSLPFTDTLYLETFENIVRSAGPLESKRVEPKEAFRLWSFLSIRKLAAILVIGFCGWMGYAGMFQREEVKETVVEIPMIMKQNPAGVKSLITLADGSKVFLNAGSSIQYPKQFGPERREIQLIGEAFFEVQHEVGRPFFVSSGTTRIKVLGTTFNVNQEESGKIAVALVTGKVRVHDYRGNQVNLDPNEMLVMEKSGEFYKTGFDPVEILGWKDKQLVFKKDSFELAKRKIENWFGVEVLVKGPIPSGWKYTGVYQDELLENVLKGIFYTSGISYKIEGKQVTIYNPN
ncbi:FecR family protein [Cyclobacterium xiamenense]|uniref:FecR family protein n=1 Tax=Cyclobacterium xiamenense TaxID=1297121 RepID=UPI0035CEB897